MQRLHAFYRSTKFWKSMWDCRNLYLKEGCWFIFCQGWSRYSGAHVRPFEFMRLLPRGLGPDLLWLRGRLDAASTFIGQIKLKLFPITPAPNALQFCTFILIDEAILVINGSYYTRLDRTFSFYRGPVWASEVYFDIGLDQSLISLRQALPLSLYLHFVEISIYSEVLCCLTASLNILIFCWSSLMQYLHQLTSSDSTPVKTDLSFVLMN